MSWVSIHPGRRMYSFERSFLPYRLWEHAGLDCAVYPNRFGGLNGYVRLPDDSPHLQRAIDYELNAPSQPSPILSMPTLGNPRGHHLLAATLHAPGGLTYGPDNEGWIGFDTNHAGDNWPKAVAKDMIQRFCLADAYQLYVLLDGIDMASKNPWTEPGSIDWTPGRVIAETNRLAEKAAVRMYHPWPVEIP